MQERGGLAGAGLGLADDVLAAQGFGNVAACTGVHFV